MQNMKTLCNITKMLSNDKPKQNAGIFDEKGDDLLLRNMETALL